MRQIFKGQMNKWFAVAGLLMLIVSGCGSSTSSKGEDAIGAYVAGQMTIENRLTAPSQHNSRPLTHLW